ncbi:MAG: hypothetical protein RJQ04_02270 [Longimicrobiales bacterium]
MVRALVGTVLVVGTVGAAGCAGGPAPDDDSPARRLLAGSAAGDYDPARLGCAVAAAPFLAESLQDNREARRALLDAEGRQQMRSHAQSVQQNMAAADRAVGLAQQVQMLERSARAAHARGDHSQAAMYSAWAGYTMDRIVTGDGRGPGFGARGSGRRLLALERDGVDLLNRYAALRTHVLDASATEAASLRSELARMDAEHPEVMEAYASLLLEVYDDPELPCDQGLSGS